MFATKSISGLAVSIGKHVSEVEENGRTETSMITSITFVHIDRTRVSEVLLNEKKKENPRRKFDERKRTGIFPYDQWIR